MSFLQLLTTSSGIFSSLGGRLPLVRDLLGTLPPPRRRQEQGAEHQPPDAGGDDPFPPIALPLRPPAADPPVPPPATGRESTEASPGEGSTGTPADPLLTPPPRRHPAVPPGVLPGDDHPEDDDHAADLPHAERPHPPLAGPGAPTDPLADPSDPTLPVPTRPPHDHASEGGSDELDDGDDPHRHHVPLPPGTAPRPEDPLIPTDPLVDPLEDPALPVAPPVDPISTVLDQLSQVLDSLEAETTGSRSMVVPLLRPLVNVARTLLVDPLTGEALADPLSLVDEQLRLSHERVRTLRFRSDAPFDPLRDGLDLTRYCLRQHQAPTDPLMASVVVDAGADPLGACLDPLARSGQLDLDGSGSLDTNDAYTALVLSLGTFPLVSSVPLA